MHNSAASLFKASTLAIPTWWISPANDWIRHTFRWIFFYTGWLSVIHLSMQHTWSTGGGLVMAAAWWVLLHVHPVRAWQSKPWVTVLMGGIALIGLFITQQSGVQVLSILGILGYVLGLSFMVHAVDTPQRQALIQSASWRLVGCHAAGISLALLFAAHMLLWTQYWPWFAVFIGAGLLMTWRSSNTAQRQPSAHVCQPDPTMALMMAFLPLFSLWCATPWLNATQHLGLHLISMSAGQILMLMLLKRFPPAVHHPMWGHALCISATGLIWASNNTSLMLVAMVLLSAGSLWTQWLRPFNRLLHSIALLLGVLSISFTAHWAHTFGPDALGHGLFFTSLIWTLSHLALHFRSSHEQRRH